MYPRKLTRSIISNPDYPVVQTKAGKLRGLWEEGVFLFRGVQYAQAKRFHLAEPVRALGGHQRGHHLRAGVQGDPHPHCPR